MLKWSVCQEDSIIMIKLTIELQKPRDTKATTKKKRNQIDYYSGEFQDPFLGNRIAAVQNMI